MSDVFYEGRDLEVLADMPNYYDWIMASFAPYVRGDVVEYGAGTGTVSCRLQPLAERLTLVELSTNLIDKLRSRFGGEANVSIVSEGLEKHSAEAASNSSDTIVMVNVLEHIEDDVGALAQSFRMLRPGGHLLIFVPAMQGLMSELDVLHGHFRRYQKPDLISKIIAAGGTIRDCHYFDLAGVLPWFFLNKLLGNTKFDPRLVNIHDRYIVPISRAIERNVSPPFGKNLVAIAERK
ncbi:MAG: class I SAM-dependent methyltransferase [Acidobacteria bacterium]|nr:class I SAM-dependent methyltransferase [Acidobacteriota bacterium]